MERKPWQGRHQKSNSYATEDGKAVRLFAQPGSDSPATRIRWPGDEIAPCPMLKPEVKPLEIDGCLKYYSFQ